MLASFRSRTVCVAALLVAATAAVAQDGFAFRTVALNGMQVPDRPAGYVFGSFNTPRINADGQVAFEATAGSGSSGVRGGWCEKPEGLRQAFYHGQDLPSLGPGYQLTIVQSLFPTVTGVSSEAFWGAVTGPGINYMNSYAILGAHEGAARVIARESDPIPGTPYLVAELNVSSVPVITPSGQAAVCARVGTTWGSGSSGILTNRSGTLAYVAQPGTPAPGLDGWTFAGGGSEPAINDHGLVAFTTTIQGPGSTASSLWVEDGGIPRLVVRGGTPAPGLPGVTFGALGSPSVNNAGQVAFQAHASGQSIWSDGSGTLSMVARVGDQAPGAPLGVQFAEATDPLISGSGGVSFRGRLNGPGVSSMNDESIWCDSAGDLRLVVREGDQAPGMPDGVVFGPASGNWLISGTMNALGQVAFASSCRGTGMPSGNSGIWFTDLDGALHYLIGTADTLTVAPGDIRTISSAVIASFSGGQDGRASSFNGRGELAFLARFTDGSQGVFVATIPEPAGIVLITTAWLLMLRRRRRPAADEQEGRRRP